MMSHIVRQPRYNPIVGRVFIALTALTCAVGWVLIPAVDVESVVVTGPILFILGLALFVTALLARHALCILLSAGHMGICVLFVVLVNACSWSPSDAYMPFMVMGAAYNFAAAPLALLVWVRWPRVFRDWQCQSCGYTLLNLDSERCPECGRLFDPAAVLAAAQRDGQPHLR